MLKSNVIWPKSRRFKSRTEWEPIGFFSEALCNSTQFDLKLGFFSSAAINVLSDGFASFIYNGGKMRMIINDILSEEDKSLIARGKSAISNVNAYDLDNLELLKETLSERDTHFFECLAWLIRNERLDIRIIKPKDSNGISHFKCGMFSDGENKVAFDGSCNFSRNALVDNRESITAFCDWDGGNDLFKIQDVIDDFELTFSGDDESVNYIDASDVRTRLTTIFQDKEIIQLLEDEERLITNRTKSQLPKSIRKCLERAKQRVSEAIKQINENRHSLLVAQNVPHFPYASGPRPYQTLAFEKWKSNNQKGLFAMATGTGKTLTSLNCLLQIYNRNHYYKAIILVPTITLVEQWETECRKFCFNRIIKVCSRNSAWVNDIKRLMFEENHCKANENISFVIISTYASFYRDNVFSFLNSFARNQVLFIADEAHNMGSPSLLKRINEICYLRRIGLSATPERQFDDKTNERIYKFFGSEKEFTFEYSMKDAIENGVLCKYFYYPHIVQLTDEEMDKYVELSIKISKYFNYNDGVFDKQDSVLMGLLLARKRIVHKAANKISVFNEIIKKRFSEYGSLKYTLVYVPEGNKPDFDSADFFDDKETIGEDEDANHLIDVFTKAVCDVDKYVTVKKFTGDTKDRDAILKDFASGKMQVLTSMKCLDEGVDVPRSEMAIFCASTGNPRQFIQRRGRVLRTSPGKSYAYIHDLVVIPKVSMTCPSFEMERRLLANELKRVNNFALLSINPSFAQMELEDVMKYYGLNLFNNDHIL